MIFIKLIKGRPQVNSAARQRHMSNPRPPPQPAVCMHVCVCTIPLLYTHIRSYQNLPLGAPKVCVCVCVCPCVCYCKCTCTVCK